MTKNESLRFEPGSLLDVPFGEWGRALEIPEEQGYRVKQLQEWVFQRRVKSYAEMSNLPAAWREKWAKQYPLRTLTLLRHETSAIDGTTRLFFKTLDGKSFSTVFLPSVGGGGDRSTAPVEEGGPPLGGKPSGQVSRGPGARTAPPTGPEEGEPKERFSLCLSTQVGCAWGCVFCASGKVRFQRNLFPSEIMEQLLWAEHATGKKIGSLLFMGMGEPLANYNHLLWALRCFRSPMGFGFGARHVTVSTSGLVPQILKLSVEAPKVNLAISLHAADDETRLKILPKSSYWAIKDLLKAAWAYQKNMGNVRVTFEYILLKGVNDSLRGAQRLSNLLRDKNSWVNLIAYNPVPGLPYEKPDEETVEKFAKVLTERGIFVRVRKPQGVDISAGCGQLGEPGKV